MGSSSNGGWSYVELVTPVVATEATQSPGAFGAMGIGLSHLLKSLKRFWPWPASPVLGTAHEPGTIPSGVQGLALLCSAAEETLTA